VVGGLIVKGMVVVVVIVLLRVCAGVYSFDTTKRAAASPLACCILTLGRKGATKTPQTAPFPSTSMPLDVHTHGISLHLT